MQIKRKSSTRSKRVMAETEIAKEATDLLFEVEDVAQLIAEVTGEDVNVAAEDDVVTFDVAGESYTCEAEEDTEVVESASRAKKFARKVAASKTIGKRSVSAGKTVRKLSRK